MTQIEPANFTLTGEFAGFFRDVRGKRRMALRSADGEIYLKVPKALRKEMKGRLTAGAQVVVSGRETVTAKTGERRRVVIGVRAVGAASATTGPFRVCSKKNCWRSGGQAVWIALEKGVADLGPSSNLSVQAVGCLGHCKLAPNVEWADQTFHHCSPAEALTLLAAAAEL